MTEFIKQQFVLFDETGKEVDWIDSVIKFTESENYWVVDNGFNEFVIKKNAGARAEIRSMSQIDFL